jgi:hypothetical protein
MLLEVVIVCVYAKLRRCGVLSWANLWGEGIEKKQGEVGVKMFM